MTTVVNAWGNLIFHAAWQAAVVAAVILVTVRLGHRWPAPIRYGLLLVALAKFALPPIIAAPSGLFSHWGPHTDAVGQMAVAPLPAVESLEPVEIRQVASSLPAVSQAVPRPWNWTAALLVVHLLGMVIVAAWLAMQWLRLRQLQASAREVADESTRERFKRLAVLLGMRRSVRLLVGAGDSVPCSFGLLRPVVIVPKSLIRDPAGDLDRVLAHELAHHRRGDLWVNAAQLALFAVWWFHPLYWLLHRSLRAVREDCCDDLMLATLIAAPSDYCETILRVASTERRTGPLAIASSMADYPHPLEKRFRRIMDGSLRRSVRLGWLGLAALVVVAAVLLPGARAANDAGIDVASEAEGKVAEEITEPAQADRTTSSETLWLGKPRTVAGRVVDESSMPVAGAKLWLPVHWTADGPLVAKATADDRDPLELLQGVERIRNAFPRPILIHIDTHYKDESVDNTHRNEVIFQGERYRFRGISNRRVNACSIFDGEQAMNYDGMGSCTIRSPSNWTTDYLFDPRTLGLTTVLRPAKDVAACLAYREAKDVRLLGSEKIAGRDAWHVRVVDKFDQQLDFWIEMPNYRVAKSEFRLGKIYRVALSEWSSGGVLPTSVATKEYYSGRLLWEWTLKASKLAELAELPPGIWTLEGLDLPVGTPVVKLFETPVDKVTGERIGYWDGTGLSDLPGKKAPSD
ncbi:MAG: M56 family metallopeptidase [Planctomycetaceae bacterium]|nr:M56 family metallopeptidase [Planctomycetaceae bacterium]